MSPGGIISGIALQADGRIDVVASYLVLAQYDRNGAVDPGFGVVGSGTAGYGIALAPNGDIVGVGASNPHFEVVRVQGDVHRPDGALKLGSEPFVGIGMFNASGKGQTIKTSEPPGGGLMLRLRFSNAGNVSEAMKVRGCASTTSFLLTYRTGGTNVSPQVERGTYRTMVLAPGGSAHLKLIMRARRTASVGDELACSVTVRSAQQRTRVDTVRAIVRVS